MKTLYSFVFFCCLVFAGCGGQETITISGEILNPGNVKVVAFYEGDRKLDSVYLSDQNKFKFVREASQPRLISIAIGKNKYPVIVSAGEELVFRSDLQNDPDKYTVSGSELSKALMEFTPLALRKQFVEDSLQRVFVTMIAGKTDQEIENIRADYLTKYKNELSFYTEEAVRFASKHPDLAGFYAMSTLDPDLAEQELIVYADQIADEFEENRIVIQFKEEVDKLRKLAVSQPAPEIIAYTPTNSEVRLSSFKGKYTLVDFWASWCVPCRKENPNIVRLYEKYKDKGFDVLGVSLDDNPGSWMRAIEEDKLAWTNVSDLKAWSSDLIINYRIKAIPTSVLLDKEGNILAKNLRGKELDIFLQSIFD